MLIYHQITSLAERCDFYSCITIISADCGCKPENPPWDVNASIADPQMVHTRAGSIQIVGGRASEPGMWPWQLSLQFNRNAGTDQPAEFAHTCGGSFIDEWWAMTAAHCVEGR